MSNIRYGAVIVNSVPGTDLPAPIVRFLRSIEGKKHNLIYEGDQPTTFGRHTGYHDEFEEWDETQGSPVPEYLLHLDDGGGVMLSRRN